MFLVDRTVSPHVLGDAAAMFLVDRTVSPHVLSDVLLDLCLDGLSALQLHLLPLPTELLLREAISELQAHTHTYTVRGSYLWTALDGTGKSIRK